MNITYKLVSDWNLKTDFSVSVNTGGVIPIASDPLFSSNTNGGSYDIFIDASGVRYGTFTKSSIYTLHYFTYYNDILSIEKIEVNGQEIKGINARLGFKIDGNPIIVYYDLNSFAISAVDKSSGVWSYTAINYVNVKIPPNKRQISICNMNGKIYGSCLYNFDDEQSVVQYIHFNGSKWTSETVENDTEISRFSSVSIVLDKSLIPFIFVGTSSGIKVYEKRRNFWQLERTYGETDAVLEIDVSYDNIKNYSHISYLVGSEVKYQRYDHGISRSLNRFLIKNQLSISK